MRFLAVTSDQVQGDRVTLTPEQEQHLVRVLRRRAGDPVRAVVAGTGRALECTIEAVRRGHALAIAREEALPPPPAPALTLAVGRLKGPKLETVVRAATELGVARVLVVASEHSVGVEAAERSGRWSAIALSASQQSGNPYPPAVEPVAGVDELVRSIAGASLVVGVATDAPAFRDLALPAADAVLAVGPEGDWSAAELAAFDHARAHRVRLAGHVLRAETACVVLATLVLDRLGRWSV
jgi:16S rRNA (uracil1498-N3)-methyltransferase